MNKQSWLAADWPAPAHVFAGTSTRVGGVSQGCYASLNLADHVADELNHVQQNRARLRKYLSLPSEPHWLTQTHGCDVASDDNPIRQADACYSQRPGQVCVVMTADCLPLLVTDTQGSCVAAIHAGWRGLQQQIISKTIEVLPVEKDALLIWLGPAIGPTAFEVGDDVRQLFIQDNSDSARCFIAATQSGKWFLDMYALARMQLHAMGIEQVYGGDHCTYTDEQHFFSYRRDNITGRMASLIWINPHE